MPYMDGLGQEPLHPSFEALSLLLSPWPKLRSWGVHGCGLFGPRPSVVSSMYQTSFKICGWKILVWIFTWCVHDLTCVYMLMIMNHPWRLWSTKPNRNMIETSQKDQKAEWNVPMMEATNRSNQKETSISSSPKPVFLLVRSRSEPATTGESNPQNLRTWRNWDPHFANLPTLGRAMSCYGVL